MKELNGTVSISRLSSNVDGDYIQISIEDASSSCEAARASMSLDAFAKALFSVGYQPCKYDINTSGVIGKKREHKTELVPIPYSLTYKRDEQRKNAVAKALKPFEVDGWIGRTSDAMNHHNQVRFEGDGDNKVSIYKVTFVRYVDVM